MTEVKWVESNRLSLPSLFEFIFLISALLIPKVTFANDSECVQEAHGSRSPISTHLGNPKKADPKDWLLEAATQSINKYMALRQCLENSILLEHPNDASYVSKVKKLRAIENETKKIVLNLYKGLLFKGDLRFYVDRGDGKSEFYQVWEGLFGGEERVHQRTVEFMRLYGLTDSTELQYYDVRGRRVKKKFKDIKRIQNRHLAPLAFFVADKARDHEFRLLERLGSSKLNGFLLEMATQLQDSFEGPEWQWVEQVSRAKGIRDVLDAKKPNVIQSFQQDLSSPFVTRWLLSPVQTAKKFEEKAMAILQKLFSGDLIDEFEIQYGVAVRNRCKSKEAAAEKAFKQYAEVLTQSK